MCCARHTFVRQLRANSLLSAMSVDAHNAMDVQALVERMRRLVEEERTGEVPVKSFCLVPSIAESTVCGHVGAADARGAVVAAPQRPDCARGCPAQACTDILAHWTLWPNCLCFSIR